MPHINSKIAFAEAKQIASETGTGTGEEKELEAAISRKTWHTLLKLASFKVDIFSPSVWAQPIRVWKIVPTACCHSEYVAFAMDLILEISKVLENDL